MYFVCCSNVIIIKKNFIDLCVCGIRNSEILIFWFGQKKNHWLIWIIRGERERGVNDDNQILLVDYFNIIIIIIINIFDDDDSLIKLCEITKKNKHKSVDCRKKNIVKELLTIIIIIIIIFITSSSSSLNIIIIIIKKNT